MPYRIYISAVEHSKHVFTIPPSTAHESNPKPQASGNNSSGSYSGRRGHSPPRDATRRVSATHHNARLFAYSHSHPDSYHSAACLFAYSHHLPVAAHHNAYAYHLPNAYYDIRAESAERCVDWGRRDVFSSSDV
jgi:hypothetical protein